jgi:LPXTG-motif cell wall-anchored protein
MDIVDIYGHISDKSELILGVGNYNNVHGLLTYFPNEDLLQMRSLPEIVTPSVVHVILTYEKPSSINNTDKVYFSLTVKNDQYLATEKNSAPLIKKKDKYINIKIELDGDRKVASACISSEKAYFWIDYSSVDKTPRSQLLAGALYSLQTTFGEQDYIVSWKIQGFSNGDLVIFLPTTWYEKSPDGPFCQSKSGVITLVESLNQLGFKGYTTQQWCEDIPNVVNCVEGTECGQCLGQCQNLNHICYPNINGHNVQLAVGQLSDVPDKQFICGPPNLEPKLNQSSMVSFSESSPPPTTGNAATWIAIIIIVIIVALLAWGFSRRNRKYY